MHIYVEIAYACLSSSWQSHRIKVLVIFLRTKQSMYAREAELSLSLIETKRGSRTPFDRVFFSNRVCMHVLVLSERLEPSNHDTQFALVL